MAQQDPRFQSSWGFLGYGTGSHLGLLRTLVGEQRNQPAPWIDWFLGTSGPPAYNGVLKRWTGASWVKAKLMVYSGGSWVAKKLMRWTGSGWVEVDATGV